MSHELALLGILDPAQRSHHSKLLISYLLFYTKKEILCKWSSPTPPTLSSWKAMIDSAMPLYKLIYISMSWMPLVIQQGLVAMNLTVEWVC